MAVFSDDFDDAGRLLKFPLPQFGINFVSFSYHISAPFQDIFGSSANSEKSVEYGTAELLPAPGWRREEADERRGPNSVAIGGGSAPAG
jgi:hypothetical protein